jgi:integrase
VTRANAPRTSSSCGGPTTLATRSLRDLLAILRRSTAQAQRRDRAARNVAVLVTAPEGRPGRPSKALNLEQAKAVLAAARPSRLYAYLVLSLLSGVRTEEAGPLTWDHVFPDTKDGIPPHVAVWRSVRKHGDTKTRKSRRTIALPKRERGSRVGHSSQATTEAVYRKQLRPVITRGAEAMDSIFAQEAINEGAS